MVRVGVVLMSVDIGIRSNSKPKTPDDGANEFYHVFASDSLAWKDGLLVVKASWEKDQP